MWLFLIGMLIGMIIEKRFSPRVSYRNGDCNFKYTDKNQVKHLKRLFTFKM